MKSIIGEIIDGTIVAKNIKTSLICEGLCTAYTLSRYRSGERCMDRLLLNAVLQRLGMAPEDFVTVLTEEEYKYFLWQEKIFSVLQDRDYETVGKLFLERKGTKIVCNERLETQFLLRIEGILAYWKQDTVKALEKYEEAARITMPSYGEASLFNKILGSGEIQILLSIYELQTEIYERDRNEEKIKLLDKNLNLVMEYIKKKMPDVRELTKLYPEVARIYGQLLCKEGNLEKGAIIYRRAIELMRDNNSSYLLEELLEKYIATKEMLGQPEEVSMEKEWLESWRYARESVDLPKIEYYFLGSGGFGQSIELISELVKKGRKEIGYTQEELSELVDCEVENLSRIENGKAAPRTKRYKKLMGTLNRPQDYYYSEIVTKDYKAYELKYKLETAIMDNKYEDAKAILDDLVGHLDKNEAINKQYIEIILTYLYVATSDVSIADGLCKQRELLGIKDSNKNKKIRKDVFNIYEVKGLSNIAAFYGKQGETDRLIEILEPLYEYYYNSQIDVRYWYRYILVIIHNLGNSYTIKGELDKAIKICREGIKIDMECMRGKMTINFLIILGTIYYEAENMKAAQAYTRAAIVLADMFKNVKLKEKAKRNYDKLIDLS